MLSLMTFSVYFKSFRCSPVIFSSSPITSSISCRSFSCTSGWWMRPNTTRLRVVEVVSNPAKKKRMAVETRPISKSSLGRKRSWRSLSSSSMKISMMSFLLIPVALQRMQNEKE